VLLESAYFFPAGIRKTARALGMSTEASYRYERGADIDIARYACDRAASLIHQVAGGTVYRGVIDVFPSVPKPVSAKLRRHRIEAFLGAPVPNEIVDRIFTRLEFNVTPVEDGWSVTVPSFRVDVGDEEDLLEEVARHHGYDQFPATFPPFAGSGSGLPHEREERELRSLLSACGYSETYGLSFTNDTSERKYGQAEKPLKLLNPMSEDWTHLRSSLVSSILTACEWNLHHGSRDLQLYELGKVYREGSEKRMLILAATGLLRRKNVYETPREFGFYDLKGDVQAVLDAFDVDAPLRTDHLPRYYHPGRSLWFGEFAVVGELHPDYIGSLKPRQRIYLAELEVDRILQSRVRHQAQPVPRYPSIRRDLSLWFDRRIRYGAIRDTIQDAGISELRHVEPFDRLDNSPSESKYSLSISLIYQSAERTLTDAEVEGFDRKIIELLDQRLGAQLRK